MKTLYAVILPVLFSFLFMSAAQGTVDSSVDAQRVVFKDLLHGDLTGKRLLSHPELLSAGTPIQTWHHTAITTPAAGYVVFVDDLAFAEFEHPCRYIFVDQATGRTEIQPATTPPTDAMSWLEMPGEAQQKLMAAKNRRAPGSEEPAAPGKSARGGELNAVLMSGGVSQYTNHVRYWNDLSNIYITLVDVYGYKDENIIVLCSDGLNPAPDQSNGLNSDPDIDGDGDDDIMYSCVLSNVQLVFGDLANTLTANDQLFVFTTDHGGTVSGWWDVYENLWNVESLYDYQLAALYDALPGCNIVTTMEQCFSGGF